MADTESSFRKSLTSSGAVDADGFTASTSFNQSLNGGVTPNPNVSTSNPWGGQYAQISGNINGSFQQDGNGVGGTFRSRPSPYVQQWLLGVQYAFTPSDQLDINYIGNRGVRMVSNWNYNQLNPQVPVRRRMGHTQYQFPQLERQLPIL